MTLAVRQQERGEKVTAAKNRFHDIVKANTRAGLRGRCAGILNLVLNLSNETLRAARDYSMSGVEKFILQKHRL